MGEIVDKAKGVANDAAGSIKRGVGKATDDQSLVAEGTAQKAKGKAQKTVGSVKGAMGDR